MAASKGACRDTRPDSSGPNSYLREWYLGETWVQVYIWLWQRGRYNLCNHTYIIIRFSMSRLSSLQQYPIVSLLLHSGRLSGISGVTGGGGGRGAECPPETSDREIFADVSGKKRQGKKGKGVKIEKKRWKIGYGSRKTSEKEVRTFFFFFFFLLFTFENDENLFWVYQNGNFLPGKSISRREKNQENDFAPSEKICLLRPWVAFCLYNITLPVYLFFFC